MYLIKDVLYSFYTLMNYLYNNPAVHVGFMGNTSLEAAQIDVIIEVSEDLFPGIRCMALKKLFSQPEKSVS